MSGGSEACVGGEVYRLFYSCARILGEPDAMDFRERLDDVLHQLTLCESSMPTKIVVINPRLRKGYALQTVAGESGLTIKSIHSIKLAMASDSWETLSHLMQGCLDNRILKQGEIVLMECLNPPLQCDDKLYKKICHITLDENTIMYCIHEWGDESDT